jgi:hypothetical protein
VAEVAEEEAVAAEDKRPSVVKSKKIREATRKWTASF